MAEASSFFLYLAVWYLVFIIHRTHLQWSCLLHRKYMYYCMQCCLEIRICSYLFASFARNCGKFVLYLHTYNPAQMYTAKIEQ